MIVTVIQAVESMMGNWNLKSWIYVLRFGMYTFGASFRNDSWKSGLR
jgi:hypothetical protein